MDAPIINRFKLSCTGLPHQFRWLAASARTAGITNALACSWTPLKAASRVLDIYRQIIDLGLYQWIESGVRDVGSMAPLLVLDRSLKTIIAGLETVQGPRELTEIVFAGQSERQSSLVSIFVRWKLAENSGACKLGNRGSARAGREAGRSTCGVRHLAHSGPRSRGNESGPGHERPDEPDSSEGHSPRFSSLWEEESLNSKRSSPFATAAPQRSSSVRQFTTGGSELGSSSSLRPTARDGARIIFSPMNPAFGVAETNEKWG